MKYVLSSTILKYIMTEVSQSSNNKYSRYNDIRRYKNTQEVIEYINNKKLISFVITETTEGQAICCVIGEQSSFSLHTVICHDNQGFLNYELWYCSLSICNESYTTCDSYDKLLTITKNNIIAISFGKPQL